MLSPPRPASPTLDRLLDDWPIDDDTAGERLVAAVLATTGVVVRVALEHDGRWFAAGQEVTALVERGDGVLRRGSVSLLSAPEALLDGVVRDALSRACTLLSLTVERDRAIASATRADAEATRDPRGRSRPARRA